MADTPYQLIFERIQHHKDYIEFRVTYHLQHHQWTVEGIGWVNNSVPAYCLRDLIVNNAPAEKQDEEKAGFVERDMSLKFQNPVLEDLTLVNIRQQFTQAGSDKSH